MTKILRHQRIPRPPKDLFAKDIDQLIEHWREHWRNAKNEQVRKLTFSSEAEYNIFLLFKSIIDCRRRMV